jgi:5-bromo-4-chloroindolyl phosphate hydrolysis protein
MGPKTLLGHQAEPIAASSGNGTWRMMREVRKKSVAPVYGLAAVWLLYCLFFPLYKFWHFAVLVALGIAAYAILSVIFPGKTEYIKEPEKPVTTGDEKIDKLMAEGNVAIAEMARLRDSIKNPEVKKKIDEIMSITDKIFKDLVEDPSDYRQVKHFADFYLPTTMKLLNTYDRMSALGGMGQNIAGTMERIETILDTTLEGYKKQLDALFADQALDIETDIVVLKSMLKKEGLADRDF